jgi:hypothetical protein
MGWMVEQRILEERQAAEKPMKEIQQIMNWYFEDMVNLQMNVEKLYRGVNRCLTLQEDALSKSVENVILQENKVKFREKTTMGYVSRMKEEKVMEKLKEEKDCHVNKTDFEKMIDIVVGESQKQLFKTHFRIMRHTTIPQMILCMGIASEQLSLPGVASCEEVRKESKVKLGRQILSQKPRFKNYYNGSECMKEYIQQTMEGIERVQERKKKFKGRFLLDFIKGFRQNFEVKSGLNVNSLSFGQVGYKTKIIVRF